MFKVFNSTKGLDLGQLSAFWRADTRSDGEYVYSDLYGYLEPLFQNGGFLAVWQCKEKYASVVRVEKMTDAWLIAGLETRADYRNRGCAIFLLEAVFTHLSKFGVKYVVSHVEKKNKASVSLHRKLGFTMLYDFARYLDGTVTTGAFTLQKCIQ